MEINSLETSFTKCSSIEIPESYYNRMLTGCVEIDEMFGADTLKGLVAGTTATITGTPGAGKTSYLSLVAEHLSNNGRKSAIASGEESHIQLAFTCKRLGVENVDIAHIKDVEEIASAMHHYDFMVVDSFQALRSNNKDLKKREFYQYAQDLLITTAKDTGCVLFFVLHITTTGLPKGGTDIIHAVDINMKLTVDKNDTDMRLFNVYKNRFGPTKVHCAIMSSGGLDFIGELSEEEEEENDKKPVDEERKEKVLEVVEEKEALSLDSVCDMLGVKQHTAGNVLRDLVFKGKMKKYGRGANAVWKLMKDAKKIHDDFSKK